MALGIVVAGFGIGSLIFAPLINYLILSRSWRMAYLIIGFIFFVVISLSALVIKRSQTESSTVTQTNPLNSIRVRSWTAGRAMLTLPFAGITLIHCFVLVSMQTMAVHLVPYATDVGISSTVSAAAVGLLGGFSVPGRLLSGFVSERIQWQRTLALSCFGMSLVLLFLFFLKGAWMLYCFVFFYGMFHGARVSAHLGILGQFFGIGSLGELIGITEAIGIFIGSLAPYLTGYVFDTSGSYSMAFLIVMALLLLSAITASVIGKPIAPYKPRHTGL